MIFLTLLMFLSPPSIRESCKVESIGNGYIKIWIPYNGMQSNGRNMNQHLEITAREEDMEEAFDYLHQMIFLLHLDVKFISFDVPNAKIMKAFDLSSKVLEAL